MTRHVMSPVAMANVMRVFLEREGLGELESWSLFGRIVGVLVGIVVLVTPIAGRL